MVSFWPWAELPRHLLECVHVCIGVCAIVTERYVRISEVSDIYQALFCSVGYWGLLYPLADPALSTFIYSCKAWFLWCLQNACRELAACPTAFGLTARDTRTRCTGIWSSIALPLYISYWVYMLHTVECHPLPPPLHLGEWKCSPTCRCDVQIPCSWIIPYFANILFFVSVNRILYDYDIGKWVFSTYWKLNWTELRRSKFSDYVRFKTFHSVVFLRKKCSNYVIYIVHFNREIGG